MIPKHEIFKLFLRNISMFIYIIIFTVGCITENEVSKDGNIRVSVNFLGVRLKNLRGG